MNVVRIFLRRSNLMTFDTVRVEHANVIEIAEFLIVVESIANDKFVRQREAHVVRLVAVAVET